MIGEIINKPLILIPSKHIFLISHMRANTSLFGHLIGSSNEVSGYYEMHIGYYSWKSLYRQKLLYHSIHKKEPVTKYYFDKILHSEHEINIELVNNYNFNIIFMLREPERTIKSICKLYRRVDSKNKLSSVEGAADYYINRLLDIELFADKIDDYQRCVYLDAECLINNTDESLFFLKETLNLKEKLSSEYKQFELTGKKKFGDSSLNINAGHVIHPDKNKYGDIIIDPNLTKKCEDVYFNVRNKLVNKCQYHLIK
ncbi:hypothetical protein [Vibrio salinus]|uniref:hypothetical protein n=1 Tax=Vibrio salinus TaxID=2899784 RepID=UPI001E36D010|nr:hypothetical protein [Vibrio salinus]MCE0493273.1 hypothetical protein [Vibrio salinus]